MKKYIKYFLVVIVLIFPIPFMFLDSYLHEIFIVTYKQSTAVLIFCIGVYFYVKIGMLLGIEKLVNQTNGYGSIRIDWPRLVIGIFLLLFDFLNRFMLGINYFVEIHHIFCITSGYLFMTTISRKDSGWQN